jgi:hypothetical protein
MAQAAAKNPPQGTMKRVLQGNRAVTSLGNPIEGDGDWMDTSSSTGVFDLSVVAVVVAVATMVVTLLVAPDPSEWLIAKVFRNWRTFWRTRTLKRLNEEAWF